jgi:hypothetical protein
MRAARKPARRSLGTWLALAFSLLSIFLTVLMVEVVDVAATGQMETSIGQGLRELAVQTADKLDRGMYTRYREVKLLAQRRDLAPGNQDLAERRAVLDSIRESYGFYEWIGLAGLDGRVQVAADGLLEGADVSQRPWFRNAQKGIHVGDVHEVLLLDKLLPRQEGEPRRFVDIAFPYKDAQGKTLGVLGAHLSWQWARSIERSVIAPLAMRGKVDALVVGSNGRVLLGPAGLQGKALDQASLGAGPCAGMRTARACRCVTRAPASRRPSSHGCSSVLPRPTAPTRARRAAPASACRSARAWSKSTAGRSASRRRRGTAPSSTSTCRRLETRRGRQGTVIGKLAVAPWGSVPETDVLASWKVMPSPSVMP